MFKNAAIYAEDIIKRGVIRAADAEQLREIMPQGRLADAEDVELLFAIHAACPSQHETWSAFFIEMAADYIVFGRAPAGYLNVEKAAWLESRIVTEGGLATRIEIDLLIAALERSRWSPASLVKLALRQIERAVRTGAGPLRAQSGVPSGEISQNEITLLRRILCAYDNGERLPITQPEAEILLSIDDATSDSPPNPAWTDLFVKALTNALMSSSGYLAPTRRAALRPEPWLNLWRTPWRSDEESALTSQAAIEGLTRRYAAQNREDRALAKLDRERIQLVTDDQPALADAAWLSRSLGVSAKSPPGESALLDILRAENAKLHPLLQNLLDTRAEAV